ncbi:MAG TPA: dienelactone hydrolase family protein [Blastocatellia bacterium]|nr:dienelactone hydrolase family protein [Blastocatellia bacterium]
MKKNQIAALLFISALLTLTVSAQSQNKVGIAYRMFTDQSRNNWEGTAPRPIATTIWYPADNDAQEKAVVIGDPANPLFLVGKASENARLSNAAKKYPLILVSHGTGGAALQMMWLGQYLALNGFIVAAASHHGNTGAEAKTAAQGFMLWWERSKDLKVMVDKLLADAEFGPRIDQARIGAAGFSLGGATVISVAGGIFDLNAFEKFCQSAERDATCEPQPEFPEARKLFDKIKDTDPVVIKSLQQAGDSYRDKRIKAVFAIATALGGGFSPQSLASIQIPIHIVVGERDSTTPRLTNAQKFASSIKQSKLTVLPGKVGHYTFLAECSQTGKTLIPVCRDADGVDRAKVHQEVSEMALKFFQSNLR